MSEQSEVQKSGETSAPPARGLEEILADPRIAASVAPVRSAILEAREFAGEITLTVERRRIREVCESFKRDGFSYLVDITAVDYSTYPTPPGDLRFSVVYHLYSFDRRFRVRLKLRVADGVKVPSVSSVWKTANWPERETFDMFGIDFEGHPNLERILTWDGFNGHPLRKDFPIRGIDTGARIYPEVFPAGGGPKEGSTGKNGDDVNIYQGEWKAYGVSPPAGPPPPQKKKAIAPPKAAAAAPAAEAKAPAVAAKPVAPATPAAPDAEAQKKKVQMEALEKRM
ncbi:MAG TPA: NADH-quinone oxidoreductase subunit C, partial [Thermoanaerobaculia bacterium]|nr:NADH-quinone oxidoreductase subunit C [Thermoanaerobaculia bacterium]